MRWQPRIPHPQDDDPTALDTVDADAARFQSLAAAVAGQNAPGDVSSELRCLAGAIYYESKGEPLAGQLAVAEVIINRARSGRFPQSLCGVVTQAGQFSFVRGGAVPAINPTLGQWKTAVAVAQVALGDAWESPASNAMFFHARYVAPSWGKAAGRLDRQPRLLSLIGDPRRTSPAFPNVLERADADAAARLVSRCRLARG